jgi:hypothetical protein
MDTRGDNGQLIKPYIHSRLRPWVKAFVRVIYFQPVHHDDREQAEKLVERHGPGAEARDVASPRVRPTRYCSRRRRVQ